MRILLTSGILPPDIGGPATHATDLAAGLRARGHQVDLLSLTDEPSVVRTDGLLRFPRRWPWPGRLGRIILHIVRARRKYDAVYSTGLYFPTGVGARAAGLPVVMKIAGDPAWERSRRKGYTDVSFDSFQTNPPSHPQVRAMRLSRSIAARLATRTTAPSHHLAKAVDGWRGQPGSTAVVGNGVALPSTIDPTAIRSWRGRLLYVGRLVDHKNVDVILRAVAMLPDTSLTVIGEGPCIGELTGLATELGISERVIFAGSMSRDQVLANLADADALVNVSSWEGLPHTVLEALVVGIPVIVTATGGTLDVIEDDRNGIVVPIGDVDALHQALSRLSDRETYARLQAAAVRSGEQLHIDAVVEDIEQILCELIQSRRVAP